MNRIDREKRVVAMMISVYCRKIHRTAGNKLCAECSELLDYAIDRLEHCPKGDEKSSCRKCTIHCYAPGRRLQIKAVMRYVGPRMLILNPVIAIRHMLDEIR